MGRGGNSLQQSHFNLLPREQSKYYQQLDDKHFSVNGVGSIFTACSSIKQLLEIAAREPGGLSRDDRAEFIRLGVPQQALLADCRYLKVNTPGLFGLKDINDCPAHQLVSVVRTKQGAPCSLVIEDSHRQLVDFGTLIIGKNKSGEEIVWTAHPGLPIAPASEDSWAEGSQVSVAEVKERLGDVWLQFKC